MKTQEIAKASTRTIMSGGSILTILLFIAKVTGKMDISWLWVFSPYWLPTAIVLGLLVVVGIIVGGWALVSAYLDMRSARKTWKRK